MVAVQREISGSFNASTVVGISSSLNGRSVTTPSESGGSGGTIGAIEHQGIRVEGLDMRFGATQALAGVDLTVAEHERVCVVGPSGCGKSTLLSLLAGLKTPTGGAISGAGLERCALMPQRDLLLPWRSALDNGCIALELAGASR